MSGGPQEYHCSICQQFREVLAESRSGSSSTDPNRPFAEYSKPMLQGLAEMFSKVNADTIVEDVTKRANDYYNSRKQKIKLELGQDRAQEQWLMSGDEIKKLNKSISNKSSVQAGRERDKFFKSDLIKSFRCMASYGSILSMALLQPEKEENNSKIKHEKLRPATEILEKGNEHSSHCFNSNFVTAFMQPNHQPSSSFVSSLQKSVDVSVVLQAENVQRNTSASEIIGDNITAGTETLLNAFENKSIIGVMRSVIPEDINSEESEASTPVPMSLSDDMMRTSFTNLDFSGAIENIDIFVGQIEQPVHEEFSNNGGWGSKFHNPEFNDINSALQPAVVEALQNEKQENNDLNLNA